MPSVADIREDRYKDATREQLLAVVSAADRLWSCLSEFDEDQGACSEYQGDLDDALAKCFGTSANFWVGQPVTQGDGGNG